jgi:hypothetical protein
VPLFFLHSSSATPLGSLNAGFVALDLTATHAHHSSRGFPRPLQVSSSLLPKEMDLNEIALEGSLDGDDRLDQERVGVLEVQVHDTHHGHSHQLSLVECLKLRLVVLVNRRSDQLGLFAGAEGSRLDVFERAEV